MHRVDGPGTYAAMPDPRPLGKPGFFGPGVLEQGIPATTITYESFNAHQEELCGVVEAAGMALDKTKNGQVLEAIQTLIAKGALTPGPDGTYLGSQDGKIHWLPWPFGQAVTDDVVWYVRPDGNDENAKTIVSADMHGSQNTAGAAFKTVAAAAAFFTANYYITGLGTITIQLGATGTYAEPSWVNLSAVSSLALESLPPLPLGWRPRARCTIAGDKNNKGAYVWSMPSDPSLSLYAAFIGNWSYEGLSIVTTGTRTTYGINFVGGGRLWNANVTSPASCLVVGNTSFGIVGACAITGNGGAAAAFHGSSSACTIMLGDNSSAEAATVITLSCPTVGSATLNIHTFARAILYANATIVGTVNGTKYSASSLSIIATGGRLATIPGTSAGGVSEGSVAN